MWQQATILSQQAQQKNEQWVYGCAWKLSEWGPTPFGEKERLIEDSKQDIKRITFRMG
jgi:hypothetical protein